MYSNNYLQNQIATASPEKLLIMFYDGAIRFTLQASSAIVSGDIETRNYAVNRAVAIISELAATLDHKIGGKIAADLDALYNFMIRELHRGNSRNDQAPFATVEDLLTGLRETWVEAIKIKRESTHVSPVPVRPTTQSLSFSL